jgi:hypothetical protein
MRLARLAPACALLATLAAPACAAGQTVTLHQAGQAVHIAVGNAATLPTDFPSDVALPATHTVVRVQRSDGSTTVVVATPGTVDEEATRFRAAMIAAGWRAAALMPPPSGIGQAWKKDRRVVIAWLRSADAGGARVQLQLLAPVVPPAPAAPATP